jgi:hypothetical protein
MAILDLKSNLSGWRKPSTVESAEKKKLSESPIKAVYSTSNELKLPTDIKINKVDNSTSIQVPGAKKIDYKIYSINSNRRRSLPAISTLFGDTILNKVSTFKKQTPEELNKVSSFIKITPRGIQHISSVEIIKTILKEKLSLYIQRFPINILKLSLYINQRPIDILKLSLYKDQIPAIISKLSLYKDQIPNLLDKLSLYKIQVPSLLDKLSLYKIQVPNLLDKLSLYKQFKINNFNSIYDTREEIIRLLRFPLTLQIYANKTLPVVNAFNDLRSGAKGFTLNQRSTQFLGLNTSALTYTYPTTVNNGTLKDITKIVGANQWQSTVLFPNRLNGTKYTRTTYSIIKPYLSSLGITGDTLEKYFYRTNSPSARDILYTAFNLRNNSFNTGLALFDQPLILSGIQRVGAKLNVFDTWKFDDGFIRGGVVTSTQRAAVDVLRIGKWLASTKGLLFIARQAGLQGSSSNTEADPTLAGRLKTGAYTLASSLANTATQHLGLRFRKDAIPFRSRTTYSGVMFGTLGIDPESGRGIKSVSQTIENNRLNKLYQSLILGTGTYSISGPLGISGGPQSVYGIGTTPINRTVNSTGPFPYKTATDADAVGRNLFNKTRKYIARNSYPLIDGDTVPIYNDELYLKLSNSSFAGTSTFSKLIPNGIFNFNSIGTSTLPFYEKVSNKSLTDGASQQYYTLGFADIRISAKASRLNSNVIFNFLLNGSSDVFDAKWISTQGSYYGTVIQNYSQTSQHQRTKLSVPDYGKRGKDLRNPLAGSFMSKYTPGGDGMTDPIWKINQTNEEAVDDFVKFMFHDLNTNERFRFRAYIENVSEDFSPNWQEVKILGRADSPYIYQGFERSVSISFKAAALSRGDLMLMWDQLERLAKTTVPRYQANAKMKGPLIKFTLGNWFINTPAFIKSLSYTVDNETPWEINLSDSGVYGGSNKENNVGELPMIVSVQVSMQIFGEVRPETAHVQKTNITDLLHYNKGNLYPLGVAGLRAARQRTVGNDSDSSEFLESVKFAPPSEPTTDDLNSIVDPSLST